MEQAFPWMFSAALIWLTAAVAASVIYRRRKGKPIIPKPSADATYVVRGVSGQFARNALMVYVTPDELTVTPMFPFTLLFLPEIYRCELKIPLEAITGIHWGRMLLTHTCVILYRTDRERRLELALADRQGLAAALRRRLGGPT